MLHYFMLYYLMLIMLFVLTYNLIYIIRSYPILFYFSKKQFSLFSHTG